MTLTLLLDLDDTLLDTNMDAFIPAYTQALSLALAEKVAPEHMIPALMSGTKQMMLNRDPVLSLREVFDADFFPRLGIPREDLQEQIDRFYDEKFPTLQYVTKPRPEALRLVDWAFGQGYRVVVATNPFFPLKAVHHRMRWAGLAPEKYRFALVSSYETFHFTKEASAYFLEILGQLGWPDDPVVMVGNDVDMDLLPAQKAGLPVYWVRDTDQISPERPDLPQGTLSSLRRWLERTDPDTLKPAFDSPTAVLAGLRSTPAALSTLISDLSSSAWQQKPAPGEWCLTEIACYLRDLEREVYLLGLRKVLAEENPFIGDEEMEHWVEERRYSTQDGHLAFSDFCAARKDTLGLLDGLQKEWSRPFRHSVSGPTPLRELTASLFAHDRSHVQQVWKTIH